MCNNFDVCQDSVNMNQFSGYCSNELHVSLLKLVESMVDVTLNVSFCQEINFVYSVIPKLSTLKTSFLGTL